MVKKQKVAAVLVAYNRKDLLRESLTALAAQTVRVDTIIVVDNASTDGSSEVAAEMVARLGSGARLISLQENTGGAGGFTVGIAAAVNDPEIDWVWVLDDDTIPAETALAEALDAQQRYRATGPDNLAVMGSRVVWIDGDDHPMNTPKPKIGANKNEKRRALEADAMPIRSISFVSAFLRAERVRQIGLPVAAYFLWNDDFEYTTRLLKGARGIYVPDSLVTHKTKIKGSSDQDPGPRFYFEVRNKLWVFSRSNSLKCWEKAAYSAASVRRWFNTFRASQNRRVLVGGLFRGLRHGIFTAPKSNVKVLAAAGVPDDVLKTVAELS